MHLQIGNHSILSTFEFTSFQFCNAAFPCLNSGQVVLPFDQDRPKQDRNIALPRDGHLFARRDQRVSSHGENYGRRRYRP
jgi:hypothetical protein